MALVGLFVLVLVAFSRVAGSEQGLFFRDSVGVFKPVWWSVKDSLSRGELPALTRWNPSGVPLEGSVAAAIYTPLTGILWLGSFDVVYDWLVLGSYLLLTFGAYAFAFAWSCERSSAFLAGALAALTGPVLSLENLMVAAQSLAFAPWIYLALYRYLLTGNFAWLGGLAVLTGYHAQGLLPEFVLMDAVALGCIVARVGLRPSMSKLPGLVAALLLAFAVASPDLVPMLQGLADTTRGKGFAYTEAAHWSFGLRNLVDLVAPSFWFPEDQPYLLPPTAAAQPYLVSLYFGSTLPLVACGLASLGKRRWMPIGLAIFGLLLILVSTGAGTPLHRWMNELPVFRSTRYPIKYWILVSLLVAASAQIALRAANLRPNLLLGLSVVHVAVMIVLWQLVGFPEFAESIAGLTSTLPRIQGIEIGSYPSRLASAMAQKVNHGLFFAGLFFAVAVWSRRWTGSNQRSWVLAGVIALDLATAGRWTIFGANVEQAKPHPLLVELASGYHPRVFVATPQGLRAPVRREAGRTDFDVITRSELQRGEHAFGGIRTMRDIDPDGQSHPDHVLGHRLLGWMPNDEARVLLARLGGGWMSTWKATGDPAQRTMEIEGEAPQYLVPLHAVRPYVAAYDRWRLLRGDRKNPREWVLGVAETPIDEAILIRAAGDDASDVGTVIPADTAGSNPAVTEVVVESDQSVRARVEATQASLVVLREQRHPGWSVTIDGDSKPVVAAEFGHVGVFVSPGAHRVHFTYTPHAGPWMPVFWAGHAAAVALLFVGWIWRRVR
jgi:hypothetical protein